MKKVILNFEGEKHELTTPKDKMILYAQLGEVARAADMLLALNVITNEEKISLLNKFMDKNPGMRIGIEQDILEYV